MKKKFIWAMVRITFLTPIIALLFFMGELSEESLVSSFVGVELYALIESIVFYNRCKQYPKVIRNAVILFVYAQIAIAGFAFGLLMFMFG